MKKVIIGAIFLALVLLGSVVGYYFWSIQPVNVVEKELREFQVNNGEGISVVAQNLLAEKLIKNSLSFRILAKLEGETGLVPGMFKVSPSMSAQEVLTALKGRPEELTVTILPGWRREEIAEYLGNLGLTNFDEEEFLVLTKDLEGQLMAETYRIFPNVTTKSIVELLHQQYVTDIEENEEVKALLAQSERSWTEILTVASLLQREARDEEQMRNIATIIYRRLDDNYPLQLCATAQYAVGKNKKTGNWWEAPSLADTQFDSPYNTYQYKGLPPTPISSVSLQAIKAALQPADNDYYFYLHDDQGRIHYAETVEEHNDNKAKYL